MLALTRARDAGTRTPLAFRAAVERARTLRPFELVERVDSACAPTCVDLDACERRYLLVGGIDGGVRVYDTESRVAGARARGDAPAPARVSPELVCVVEGAGARETHRAASRAASGTAATTSDARGHAYATSAVRWLPSDTGVFFTASYDKTVKCWDANTLRAACDVALPTKCHALAPSDAASPRSLVAVGADDDVVRLWDPASNAIAHTLSGHRGSVRAIEWLPSNAHALATGGAEGDVRFWDIRRAGAYMILDRHNTQPSARVDGIRDAMHAVARASVGADASRVGGRDDAAPSRVKRARVDATRARRRDASPSARVGAPDGYGSTPAPAHDGAVRALRATPCGLYLVSAGADGRVRRWDARDGLNAYVPYDASGASRASSARQLAITDDGERLYVPCADARVRAYRARTGALDFELRGHLDGVVACAYKDGGDAALFTVGADANVLVWAPAAARARDDDGDAWSDDDDDGGGGADARGRATTVADPGRARAAPRGLGYRSIARCARRP